MQTNPLKTESLKRGKDLNEEKIVSLSSQLKNLNCNSFLFSAFTWTFLFPLSILQPHLILGV